MAAAEPGSSAQPTPQAQAQPPPPPPPGAPSSQPPVALSSRHEKSLGLLTTKFVSLLQEAQDGVLDLKAVRGGGDRAARPEGAGSARPPGRWTEAAGRTGKRGRAGYGPSPAGSRAALATKEHPECGGQGPNTQEFALCSGLTQGWFAVGKLMPLTSCSVGLYYCLKNFSASSSE